MELVTPGIGLMFWMLVSFSIVLYILKKFAWKPILQSIHDREDSIEAALRSADKARDDMARIQADNEKILNQSRIESEKILRESKELGDKYIADARKLANVESTKMIEEAKRVIESEKVAAINQVRNEIAELSISIAEKLLKSELTDMSRQSKIIQNSLDNFRLN